MNVIVEIEEDQRPLKLVEVEVTDTELELPAFLRTVSEKADIPAEELLADLGVGDVRFLENAKVGECLRHGNRWHHKRVCIDLHFESEQATHFFPARGKWIVVHKWGCHRFEVPSDACANLELHDGSPAGPVLNDKVQIGEHKGCKTVWLVKPGPEPYGGSRG